MIRRLLNLPRRGLIALGALVPIGAVGVWLLGPGQSPLNDVPALAPPDGAMRVYHLGHSLVGADMPVMLAQLSGVDHRFNVQRGSGTSLRAHWEDSEPILDFDMVNAPPVWRDPKDALQAGDYDAVIFTEMVELRDALKYFDAAEYLHRWAQLARRGNPDTRLYIYETWHRLDDPDGWLTRIDNDLQDLWLGRLLAKDRKSAPPRPLYLIPGGQALAAVTRAAEAGEIPGLDSRDDLFDRLPDGALDQIHLSPLGAYVVALTHYAVLYHQSPEGVPHEVTLADGRSFTALDAEGARQLQAIVWGVVTRLPRTGVQAASSFAISETQ